MFQSTPPRRGDIPLVPDPLRGDLVSIHAPAKGRPASPPAIGSPKCAFQSTPPRRGDPYSPGATLLLKRFNPRPREGATGAGGQCRANKKVSIHAPAKGRHLARVANAEPTKSFNPRPREGATRPPGSFSRRCSRFNPRPREGATPLSAVVTCFWWSFNPRPREGATFSFDALVQILGLFQSTPPRRGDVHPSHALAYDSGFQSTPPRRGDGRVVMQKMRERMVSIHAPAKGRRPIVTCPRFGPLGFNPRPREGATPVCLPQEDRLVWFQSTPPRRGDGIIPPFPVSFSGVSIHAPAKGRQASASTTCTTTIQVSIHAPAKGRPTAIRSFCLAGRIQVSIHAPAKGRRRHPN